MLNSEKLRNCSASVLSGDFKLHISDGYEMSCVGYLLKSYNSIVAAIVAGEVILLPRADYSATTMQHLRKFCEDHAIGGYRGINWYRKNAKLASAYSLNGSNWHQF